MTERIPLIAGNWKMNKTVDEAVDMLVQLKDMIKDVEGVEAAVCPTFTALYSVGKLLAGTNIALGAQNCYWEEKGAYTGEIAPPMLKEIGCQYCIIGHSERRQYFNETDENINKKATALYKVGIVPIICVGETLEQREKGVTMKVVETQIRGCLAGLPADKVVETVIAYEPVWAIGTGKTATPEQAQEVHAFIRSILTDLYGEDVAQKMRIQYGGSVKPDNVKELMAQPDIDGALVGGASLDAEKFSALIMFKQ
jgi:triosephosphate isomerase